MNLEQLKKQNPSLYAQCMSLGVEEGIQKERSRCISLLPKHVSTAASKYAIKCIRDGSPFGDKQKAQYMAFQLTANHKQQQSEKVVSMVEYRVGIRHEDNNS